MTAETSNARGEPFAYVVCDGKDVTNCAELRWPGQLGKVPRGAKAAWRDLPPGTHPLYLAPPPPADAEQQGLRIVEPVRNCATPGSREAAMVVLETDEEGNPTIWCDPEVADLVRALNVGGVRTKASCSGHGEKPFGIVTLKDGRELLVMPDWETTRRAERLLDAGLSAQEQGQAVACVCCEDKPAPGNNPCGWCGRTAPPSAPVGVEDVVMAARNAENTIRNCAAAGQIGDGYVQYADALRDAVQRLAQQPAAAQPDWGVAPPGATHYQPHQGAYYKRASASEWYVWSRMDGRELLRWLPSPGTSDSAEWVVRPAECSDGCPPQQVCDYCQIASLAQQPAAGEVDDDGRDAPAQATQAVPQGWPRAAKGQRDQGWTLDCKFLERVTDLAASRTEYSTSMEATEQVLIAALEVLATQRQEPKS